MLLQQLEILILKGSRPVMFALMLDVTDHGGNIGFADREGTVPILPPRQVQIWKLRVNPFGGIAFQKFGDVTRSMGGWSQQAGVDVIFNATCLKSGHLVPASYATDVGPDAIFNVRFDGLHSILRAEDEVVKQSGVGVRHRSLADAFNRRGRDMLYRDTLVPGFEKPG